MDLMLKGGPLMWLILFNGLLALAIFFERWLHFHRAQIHAPDFVSGIRNALKRGNYTEAVATCEETAGPVAQVVKTAIEHRTAEREEIREAVDESARTEISRLERRLVVLATIAQVTPLVGFLGTVMGMIQMFRVIQDAQLPSPGQLAGGVWTSLLTTAAGLVVAVPAYVAYNILTSRVQHLVLDMEKAATEIVGFLLRGDARSDSAPRVETPVETIK